MRVAEIHPGIEGYLLLFGWVFAEQIGLPLPAAPALLAAGALAAGGSLNAVVLIVVALAASVLADYLWYRAGTLRRAAVSRFLRRNPDSRVLHIAERLVLRYGSRTLVFAKFVPGLSLVAPPLAGMWGISTAEFLAFDTLGSLVWIGGFIGIGFFFGSTVGTGSMSVSPLLYVGVCVALAVGAAAVRFARSLWNKLHKRSPLSATVECCIRIYKEEPAKLPWLASLITGDPTPGAVLETPDADHAGNPFFAQWMVTWSRKLVIAKALGNIATELRGSVRRTALAEHPAGLKSAPPTEWSNRHPIDRFQLERALMAIDVFPRCALLLTIFDGLSIEDTVILLGANKKQIKAAQAIGLNELSRNLEHEQGCVAVSHAPRRPKFAEMQPAL